MGGVDTAREARRGAGRLALVGLAGALLVAAAVVLNQSAVHWRENVVDSHLFAYHGWCVSVGARPYIDIWDNKPPGIWWLNALGFRLCGEGIGGEVLICSVALTVSLAAFIGAARAAYHPSLTVLAALTGCVLLPHLFYEGGANRTETFVVTCETLAVCAYLRWLRGSGWFWLVLAGLAAGAAPLFKQSGIAAAGACALHLAWMQFGPGGRTRRRIWPWLVAGGGFVVPPLAALVALALRGALGEASFAVAAFNRAYFAIGDATYTHLGHALRIYWEVITPLAGLFAAAGIGLIWSLWRRSPGPAQPTERTYVAVFWLWLILAAYLACVGPGRRGHHFMPVLPALGLLALYPLHRLAVPGGLRARLAARPSAAVLLVLYLYVLALLGGGHAVELQRCWQQKPHWYALSYDQPPGYQLQAAEIRRLTRSDERIYVWGWSPGTYRYAYRRCASRFATFEKLGQVGARARFILDQAVQDLRRSPPAVLVFSSADLQGLTGEFAEWLAAGYEDRGVVGGMHILTRRESLP